MLGYAFIDKKMVCAEIVSAFTLWNGSLVIKHIVKSAAEQA